MYSVCAVFIGMIIGFSPLGNNRLLKLIVIALTGG